MDPSQSWRPLTTLRAVPDPTMAYHLPMELYDLENDPHETNNIVGQSEWENTQRDMSACLYRWLCETSDSLLQGIPAAPVHQTALQATG